MKVKMSKRAELRALNPDQVVLVVKVKRPPDAKPTDVARYVREAISSWGGCLEPPHADEDGNERGDPMFGHQNCTVRVV